MAALIKLGILGAILAVAFYLARPYIAGGECASQARLDGKVIIVTGSNTGIGKETVKDLVLRGGKVYMACRSLDKANAAAEDVIKETNSGSDQVIVIKLDLSSQQAIREFVQDFKKRETRLDILISNAAVMAIDNRTLSVDGIEMQMATNHFGHFLLTNLLLDMLVASAPSRVVTVASSAHEMVSSIDFDDINLEENYGPWTAYGQSKMANILFSGELAKKLKGSGVTTYSLHPGVIFTDLQRHSWILQNPIVRNIMHPFSKTLKGGAQTQICCAVDETLAGETGLYYSDCAVKTPSAGAQSDEDSDRLWDLSVKMVNLKMEEMPKIFQKP